MTTVIPHLKRITLHLARTKEFPEGSAAHGYEITAPLDAKNHIDVEGWKRARALCRVRRFWGSEPDEHGLLVHRPGGAQGATWVIDYDAGASDDDEAGYRFGEHAFAVGDYVSIRDDEGVLHPFKVAKVSD